MNIEQRFSWRVTTTPEQDLELEELADDFKALAHRISGLLTNKMSRKRAIKKLGNAHSVFVSEFLYSCPPSPALEVPQHPQPDL